MPRSRHQLPRQPDAVDYQWGVVFARAGPRSAHLITSESANRAVFLSYARENTDAVRRIADVLRSHGVEVWFDQSELVGGDAWDNKIRGQIGSCALFVAVISAATQARYEGYFRLEWKLAAHRTHMISERTAFLLPVVIDDTRDADADADFQRAVSLSPNSALVRQRHGLALYRRGKLPAAIAELQLSVRLDPLSAINLSVLCSSLTAARRWEEALAASEKALAIDPNFPRARAGRMDCLFHLGRQAEALEMARVTSDDPDSDPAYASRALALRVRAGDTAAFERAKQALAQPTRPGYRSARSRLEPCLALNRLDEALAVFESGRWDATRNAANLDDPQFDPIRTDPRFLRKVEKDGLLADYREAWSHVPESEKKKAAKR